MTNTIRNAYEILKVNEDYWLFDNDYKRKYSYIKEFVTTESVYTNETVEYIADIADFMLNVHNRIFGKR